MATTTTRNSSSKGIGGALGAALSIILPRRSAKGGMSMPGTYNPSAPTQLLTMPTYREHLTDIFSSRTANDSRALIKTLLVQDPDVSAAANAYLTVANTDLMAVVYDVNGMIDRDGQKILNAVMQGYEVRNDYSKGFDFRPSFKELAENFRYMILAGGSLPCEMVLDKTFVPTEFRMLDPKTLWWIEPQPGVFTPEQRTSAGDTIDLTIPTFFCKFFRRDPTTIYTYSPFVSAINTIAGRQQVINDLYRIMQLTGYPRLEVKVLEDVITRNAPLDTKANPVKLQQYVASVINGISGQIANIRPDQAFVHTDSSEVKMINDKAPGMGIDISSIIETLNAQNQAGLRTMGTILGRGNAGVNTASVEARLFSMTAEEINQPIADLFSDMLTLAIRLQGSQSRVVCKFRPAEMRPLTELEPQLTMRASRLKADLSLGIIDDDEYHLEMYGRIRPDSAPILSGTNFMPGTNVQVLTAQDNLDQPNSGGSGGDSGKTNGPHGPDVSKVSPNSDPLGRSLSSKGSKSAASNAVKP
ncbi:hypothetical protein [Burkholderia sp. Bp8998]|uniref:hypothetical protein n=1 Tax=Burkholderia sp. Bp8998 TaxID=2184557 RepID=UPI000F5B4B6E|nr:hypothetical protein [Burkholderia sp. Bp8998]